jgi:hypothetical protein
LVVTAAVASRTHRAATRGCTSYGKRINRAQKNNPRRVE